MVAFLYGLKSLVVSEAEKGNHIVVMITSPVHLLRSTAPPVVTSLHHTADYVVAVETFNGAKEERISPAFAEYSGMFHLRKLPVLHSLRPHTPETMDYVFTKKKRKLTIEVFHLPPEISRTGDQGTQFQQGAVCGSESRPDSTSVIDF